MEQRRYSWDMDPDERAPLDSQSSAHHQRLQQHHRQQQQQPQPQYYEEEPAPYDAPPTSPARTRAQPGGHPDSDFNRLREQRRQSRGYEGVAASGMGAAAGAGAGYVEGQAASRSAPQPPPHRQNTNRSDWSGRQNITPGADNFGETAAGGLAGIASSVAERTPRESGREAMRGGPPQYSQSGHDYNNQRQQSQRSTGQSSSVYDQPQDYHSQRQQSQRSAGQASSNYDNPQSYGYGQGYEQYGRDAPADRSPVRRNDPYPAQPSPYYDPSPNLTPMGAAAFPSGRQTPARSQHSGASDPFEDTHAMYGQRLDPRLGHVDPNDIMDDGDDGLEYNRPSARGSMLSLGTDRGATRAGGAAAGAAGGAAAGGIVGGILGRNRASGNYDPVHNASNTAYHSGGGAEPGYDLGRGGRKEQSEWLQKQSGSKKKWKWVIIVVVAVLIIGGIVGGVVGGLLAAKSNNSGGGSAAGGGGGQTADQDTDKNGDLNINSAEIKSLMNNPNLHKVFPGVDYTPLSVQYPDCLKWPPSQNNVTRDVAVLSQLTNTIRLYGTDCNQTEMTIHALQQLKLDTSMKIWLGVWQDNNTTTNARQLSQMWNILDKYGDKYFKGLIIANEILFRQQMTATQLGTLLSSVRTNLTSKGLSLPVATSDLGDKWDANLAQLSDYIMANIHPFFAGEPAKTAASWTNTFWTNQAGSFFKSDKSKNVIAETGWPTGGGTDCGTGDTRTDCPDKSVAGVNELNTFMDGWVCQALANSTNYFWFEMFDEPWKISFNTPGKAWEDKWGLMDVNRNLKNGVKIPDCGGKTVGAP